VVHEKFIFVSIFIGFYDVSLEQDLIWLVQAIGPSITSYFDVFFFFWFSEWKVVRKSERVTHLASVCAGRADGLGRWRWGGAVVLQISVNGGGGTLLLRLGFRVVMVMSSVDYSDYRSFWWVGVLVVVRLDSGVVDGAGREEVRMLDDRVEEDVMGLCTPMAWWVTR
jgi:hypothetical protein